MKMWWRWGIIFLLAMSVLVAAYPVGAHATLIRSVPPANAVLDQAPEKIQLWFTEKLEPSESGIDVLDSTGRTINAAESVIDASDPTSMSVEPGPMPDGIYTIAWHNVSRDDGHALSGSFAITIGQASPRVATPGVSNIDPAPEPGRTLSQWLLFLFGSMVIGGVGFWMFIWKQSPSADQPRAERWLRRLLWIGYAGLGTAIALSLLEQLTQAASVAGGATLARIFGTRFGAVWLARLFVWTGLGFSLVWSTRTRRPGAWWIPLILGVSVLLTISLLSHSISAQAAVPALAADWLHLTATALWVGGLVAFAVVLTALKAQPDVIQLRATLTQYFSNMARVAVAALLLTGLYATWLQVGSPEALVDTRYGQTLLLKLALVVPLLLIAAVNLLLTQRRLDAAAQNHTVTRWSAILRGLVGGEVVLTALVLLVVGALTSSVPARSVREAQAASATTSVAAALPTEVMHMTSTMHIILGISSGYTGSNTFTVGLYDLATGQPIDDASLVKLQFTAKDVVIGSSQLRATWQGKGKYTVTGANLSLPGDWTVRISVQRPNQYDEVVDFPAHVSPAPVTNSPGPLPFQNLVLTVLGVLGATTGGFFLRASWLQWRSGSGLLALGILICSVLFVGTGLFAVISRQGQPVLVYPGRVLFGLEMIVAAIVLAASSSRLRRIRAWAGVASVLFAVTLALLGVGVISSGFVADYIQAPSANDPIPADASSLARGKQIYQANCMACHGVSGRGDGPASTGLQPPPADLRAHMGAGHSDGQVFEWLSNGIPNSAMPGFGNRLSENDRWNVINYIRSFANQ